LKNQPKAVAHRTPIKVDGSGTAAPEGDGWGTAISGGSGLEKSSVTGGDGSVVGEGVISTVGGS